MIVIELTNVKDLVSNERGWLTAQVGAVVTDLEAKVEAQVIEQMKKRFGERGIEANIASVAGMKMSDVEANNVGWSVRDA